MNIPMKPCSEKNDPIIEKILKDKDKFIEQILRSPSVVRKHDEAVEALSQLKPPFPWDEPKTK